MQTCIYSAIEIEPCTSKHCRPGVVLYDMVITSILINLGWLHSIFNTIVLIFILVISRFELVVWFYPRQSQKAHLQQPHQLAAIVKRPRQLLTVMNVKPFCVKIVRSLFTRIRSWLVISPFHFHQMVVRVHQCAVQNMAIHKSFSVCPANNWFVSAV